MFIEDNGEDSGHQSSLHCGDRHSIPHNHDDNHQSGVHHDLRGAINQHGNHRASHSSSLLKAPASTEKDLIICIVCVPTITFLIHRIQSN